MLTGFRASGRQRSVMQDSPTTFRPACTAHDHLGDVDMPTASAPIVLRNLYSALVSRQGPVRATYTPRVALIPRARASTSSFDRIARS